MVHRSNAMLKHVLTIRFFLIFLSCRLLSFLLVFYVSFLSKVGNDHGRMAVLVCDSIEEFRVIVLNRILRFCDWLASSLLSLVLCDV